MASIRNKTLVIVGTTLVGLILVLYLNSQFVIMNSYEHLEEKELERNVLSARDLINTDLENLEKQTAVWSVWDETYSFASDNNTEYIDNYLMDDTFIYQRINFALFYDPSGDLVYEKYVDLVNEKEMPACNNITEHFKEEKYLLEHEDILSRKTGYLVIEDDILMITSQPITFSNETGIPGGTVMMGRKLNTAEIASLSERTRTALLLKHTESSSIALARNEVTIKPINESVISGSLMLNDIYGKASIELEAQIPRDIYIQGKTTSAYLLFTLLIVAAVFGGVVISLLENNIVSKLNSLNSEIEYIGRNKAFSNRLEENGNNDEIAHINSSINKMLEELDNSHKEIAKRDETIKAIIQAIPDIMFQIKRDGTIFNYKLSMENCLYESPDAALDIKIADVLPANIAEEELKVIEKALETKQMQTMRYQLPVKGELRDFQARIVVSGQDEVMSVVTDITEMKQAEDLQKKDILLKEIHHRVKNNLQVMSSLLKLQSRKFKDPDVIEAFKESQHRARSMAIAHEKLYQSQSLEDIDFKNYIQSIVEYLVSSYGFSTRDIKININIEDISLGVDTSIPLGLIINEIVSNALKHAFKDDSGEIDIKMYHSDDGTYKLNIADNGIGVPEELDFRNTDSLGLQLVNSLVDQIEGHLELKRNKGTEFEISFKELSYERRDYL